MRLERSLLEPMDIPNEIILEILKFLPKCDLKSARLLSWTWNHFATELLFDQVYVSAHPDNLKVFNAIAQNPRLSRCIKTLRYDAVDFVSTWSKSQYFFYLWRQTYDDFHHLSGSSMEKLTSDPEINAWVKLATVEAGFLYAGQPSHECFKQIWEKCNDYDFIFHGFKKYRRYSTNQRAQYTNGAFLENVVAGLQKLRRLSCVIVGDRWSNPEVCPLNSFDDSKGLLLRRMTGSPLSRGWNMFHTRPQSWEFRPQRDNPRSEILRGATNGAGHYWFITAALLRSQRTIQTFKVGDDLSNGVPPYVFDRSQMETPSSYSFDIVAFSGLQVLKLSIAAYGGERTPELFPNIEGLRFLLGSMHRLRVLNLNLPKYPEGEPACYSYNQVFPRDGRWSQLTSLSLSSFESSATDLLTLVTRKTPKLSQLELGTINLLTGTWEGVFECMMRSRHLTKFDIVPETQFWHCKATRIFPHEHAPGTIEEYVEYGGRHPYLRSDEPDSAAQKYITEDLKPFCEVRRRP